MGVVLISVLNKKDGQICLDVNASACFTMELPYPAANIWTCQLSSHGYAKLDDKVYLHMYMNL